jgi:hypothetical protein
MSRTGEFAGVSKDLLFRRQLECYRTASQMFGTARIRVPDACTSSAGESRSAFNGWQQVTKNPMKFRPIARSGGDPSSGRPPAVSSFPDTAQEKPMEGEVVAMGPGARNEQA